MEVKVKNMMDDRDVLAKQTVVETMLKASKILYHMVASRRARVEKFGY